MWGSRISSKVLSVVKVRRCLAALALALCCATLFGFDRVPKPDFETDYSIPELTTPNPRSAALEYLDLAVFVVFQAAAVYFAIKLRRRILLAWLSAASVAYFGFFRKGCVCPVGATQNITLALFQPEYLIPLVVILFFIIPIITTLLFGRTFCAAVCPLGAVQDLVVFKPVSVPPWLAKPLGFLPVLYLGFAVLFAATGSEFIICRYDPFVSLFRLGGSFEILLLGAIFIVLGLFIPRPYCRFFCPYGLLLSWVSRLSKRHVTITPDECIQCKLCEKACPVDAIDGTTLPSSSSALREDKKRASLVLLIAPFVVAAGGLLGYGIHQPLSSMHPTVITAKRVHLEESGLATGMTLRSETFRASKNTQEALFTEADDIIKQFRFGATVLGVFIGIMISISFLGLFRHERRTDYAPNRANCVSCGRCFSYCPREHLRRSKQPRDKPAATAAVPIDGDRRS